MDVTLTNNLSALEQSLVEKKKAIHAKKGDLAAQENKIELEVKKLVEGRMENAPMDSVTAGRGEELVPDVVTLDTVIEQGVKEQRYAFLNGLAAGRLPGVLAQTTDLPIIGDYPAAVVTSEWTSGTYGPLDPQKNYTTDKVTLRTQQVSCEMGISKELELYGVISALNYVRANTIQSTMRGIADAVLNADNDPAATGNINSDDQAAATAYGANATIVNFDDGLRKQPVNGTVDVDFVDVAGAITVDEILDATKLLRFDFNPSDYIMIMNYRAYATLLKDIDLKDISRNGRMSTISEGAVDNVAGMDIFVTDLMRPTNGTGKVNTLTANDKGQIIIAKRNTIQHGFTTDLVTRVQDHDLLKGFVFQAYTMFGFANINKTAGITEPAVISLHNITV